MKRVFFCGVLPSKYSGRWRDWPQFDFAKEKRNSPQTPLPLFLCSNGTGTEAGGQKFLPPNPPSATPSLPKAIFLAVFSFFSLSHPPNAEKTKELPFFFTISKYFGNIIL